jgi:hypothetical protein
MAEIIGLTSGILDNCVGATARSIKTLNIYFLISKNNKEGRRFRREVFRREGGRFGRSAQDTCAASL